MLIGQLAVATGCTRDTLRFYEKLGLIQGRAGAGSGYRRYGPQAIERVQLIQHAKLLGFTLAEIGALLDDWESGRLSFGEKQAIFRDKIVEVDQRIAALQAVRAYLEDKLRRLETDVRAA